MQCVRADTFNQIGLIDSDYESHSIVQILLLDLSISSTPEILIYLFADMVGMVGLELIITL